MPFHPGNDVFIIAYGQAVLWREKNSQPQRGGGRDSLRVGSLLLSWPTGGKQGQDGHWPEGAGAVGHPGTITPDTYPRHTSTHVLLRTPKQDPLSASGGHIWWLQDRGGTQKQGECVAAPVASRGSLSFSSLTVLTPMRGPPSFPVQKQVVFLMLRNLCLWTPRDCVHPAQLGGRAGGPDL